MNRRYFSIWWRSYKKLYCRKLWRNILEVDVQYPEKLYQLHNDLPFLPGRKKIEKVKKLALNLHDKAEHVIHIGNLKQALNHG